MYYYWLGVNIEYCNLLEISIRQLLYLSGNVYQNNVYSPLLLLSEDAFQLL